MKAAQKFLLPAFLMVSLTGLSQGISLSSGRIIRYERFHSEYVRERTVDVWLPDGYSDSVRYAVLYMHDGQMLFDSSVTWNHQEWGVDETAGRLMRDGKIRKCIVVGIHNGGALRHSEYFPQRAFRMMKPGEQEAITKSKRQDEQPLFSASIRSDLYLKFLVKELKPFIDSAFSTDPGRRSTFVAGSSMGGLISMYAICEYPKVFGGAACLSTHWPGIFGVADNPVPGAFMKYLRKRLPDPRKHKIYFDYGTETLDRFYKPYQEQADVIMKKKGYAAEHWMTRAFPGDDHSERSWSARLAIPLTFLLGQ